MQKLKAVLVPIVTGLNPSVALFSAGVGTLIFHFCTKKKVPVFLGSSFAFIPVILTVKELFNGDLAYAQGGIFVAGLIYVLISLLINKIGIDRIQRVLARTSSAMASVSCGTCSRISEAITQSKVPSA